jgi:hypothetical protein
VSTLLALMDGLDSRGAVVLVAATNRPDAVDPALRRPGRFDRELLFPLPAAPARRSILDIHTRAWAARPPAAALDALAARTAGYAGADLKGLAAEAALASLRRTYPQIYATDAKLALPDAPPAVTAADWAAALRSVVPAAHRAAAAHARPLPAAHVASLGPALEAVLAGVAAVHAAAGALLRVRARGGHAGGLASAAAALSDDDEDDSLWDALDGGAGDGAAPSARPARTPAPDVPALVLARSAPPAAPARALVTGAPGCGASAVAAAALDALEGLRCVPLSLPSLLAAGGRSPEEAVVAAFTEARRAAPAILFLPAADAWWAAAPRTLRAALAACAGELAPGTSLILLASADAPATELDPELVALLAPHGGAGVVVSVQPPSAAGRRAVLAAAAADLARPPSRRRPPRAAAPPPLPLPLAAEVEAGPNAATTAPPPLPPSTAAADTAAVRALRVALRGVATRLLLDRRFRAFAEPTPGDGADSGPWIADLLARVDSRYYPTAASFMAAVAEFPVAARADAAGARDAAAARAVAAACAFEDEAAALLSERVPPELEARTDQIAGRGGGSGAEEEEGGEEGDELATEAATAPDLPAPAPPAPAPVAPPLPPPPLPPPSAAETALAESALAAAVAATDGWPLAAVDAAAARLAGAARDAREEDDRAAVVKRALEAAFE